MEQLAVRIGEQLAWCGNDLDMKSAIRCACRTWLRELMIDQPRFWEMVNASERAERLDLARCERLNKELKSIQ